MDNNSRKIPNEIIFLVATVVVVLISLIGLSDASSPFLNTLYSPIIEPPVKAGNSVVIAFKSIGSINEIRRERNDLLEENALLKAENSTISLLKDELELLKSESLVITDPTVKLVEAEVLSNQDEDLTDFLILNKGSNDGVNEGDLIRLGSIYIGEANEVTSRRTKVLLPTYGKSFIEVVIVPKQESIKNLTTDEINHLLSTTEKKIWKGVAVGRGTGIIVENIETNAEVFEGDHVIVNDADTGKLLYLGDLGPINVDPSDVGLEVNVVLPINYQNLINLIIESAK